MSDINWAQDGPGIHTVTLTSAESLIELLRRSNDVWWEDSAMPWLFRGHARENWKLLPSAWRAGDRVIANAALEAASRYDKTNFDPPLHWIYPPNYSTGAATFGPEDAQLKRRLCVATNSEVLVLFDFASALDRHGHTIPLDNLPPDRADQPNFIYQWSGSPLSADNYVQYHDMQKLAARHNIMDYQRGCLIGQLTHLPPHSSLSRRSLNQRRIKASLCGR